MHGLPWKHFLFVYSRYAHQVLFELDNLKLPTWLLGPQLATSEGMRRDKDGS